MKFTKEQAGAFFKAIMTPEEDAAYEAIMRNIYAGNKSEISNASEDNSQANNKKQ